MNPTAAAWVRQHAWTDAVRAEAKRPGRDILLGPRCQCQRPFTSAPCAGGSHTSCDATPIWTAESVLIGLHGWIEDLSRPVPGQGQSRWAWLWLADRTCVHRCDCPCHGHTTRAPTGPSAAPAAAVQPGLFRAAA